MSRQTMKRYRTCINSVCLNCEEWLCATVGDYTGGIRCGKCGAVNIFHQTTTPLNILGAPDKEKP